MPMSQQDIYNAFNTGDRTKFSQDQLNAESAWHASRVDPFAGQRLYEGSGQLRSDAVDYMKQHPGWEPVDSFKGDAPPSPGLGDFSNGFAMQAWRANNPNASAQQYANALYGPGTQQYQQEQANKLLSQHQNQNAQNFNAYNDQAIANGGTPQQSPMQQPMQQPYQPQNNMSIDQQRHAPQVYHAPQGNYGQQQQYQQPQGNQQPSSYGQAPAYGGQQSNPYAPQQPQSQNGLLSTSQGGRNRYGLLSY